jgi:hypothetical protein
MSIKLIARDLYRCRKQVEQLEAALAEASNDEKAKLEEKLREAQSDRAFLRKALDGQIGR